MASLKKSIDMLGQKIDTLAVLVISTTILKFSFYNLLKKIIFKNLDMI